MASNARSQVDVGAGPWPADSDTFTTADLQDHCDNQPRVDFPKAECYD